MSPTNSNMIVGTLFRSFRQLLSVKNILCLSGLSLVVIGVLISYF